MSVSTAIKAAILRTTGVVVTDVYASTQQVAIEMADLANEVAADIASTHDWRVLTKIAEIVGDGSLAYDLPADFDRMLLTAEVDDGATWVWGYQQFGSVNDWARYTSGTYAAITPGGWILLGGQMQFYPAPVGTAKFPYISKQWGRTVGGMAISAFTADTDEFLLDERLLTLGLIWRWLDQKGLQYSEALATYETALARAQARDKGAYVLRSPTRSRGGLSAYINRAR